MKIVFFTAGGPLGLRSVEQLAVDNEILAVVRPERGNSFLRKVIDVRRRGSADLVSKWARDNRVASLRARSAVDIRLVERIKTLRPDVLCVVGFPWLLSADLFSIPDCGTVNLHPSVLPRHRGPNPFFWTYYRNDAEAGLTAHIVDEGADTGPIISQENFPLERGRPVEDLYLDVAQRSGKLLAQAILLMGSDYLPVEQDSKVATLAPRVAAAGAMVNFEDWDVERVWHFLAGMYPRFRETLRNAVGEPVDYKGVMGFERGSVGGPLGAVEATSGGQKIWCRDGCVHVV